MTIANQRSGLRGAQLGNVPLFRDLKLEQRDWLAHFFRPVPSEPGTVLFRRGEPANQIYLLLQGEVHLNDGDEHARALHPPSLIGELGALAGLQRNTTATVSGTAELWKMSGRALLRAFPERPDVGLRIQLNLLTDAADKINRDQTRLEDMRRNIIHTQKAMKQMRDFILASQDTVISRPIHNSLEGLIRQNRRANYRVVPPTPLAAHVRLDAGRVAPVVEISRTHLSCNIARGPLPAAQTQISAILTLDGPEIPFSGRILRTVDRRVDLELDPLIDEYTAMLEGYLTRVQMLDYLV